MGVKLHHGEMNMGKICFSLVARYKISVEMLPRLSYVLCRVAVIKVLHI